MVDSIFLDYVPVSLDHAPLPPQQDILLTNATIETIAPEFTAPHVLRPRFRIMPPKRMNQNVINRLVVDRVATAIAEYEANRANAAGVAAGGPGPAVVGGIAGGNVGENNLTVNGDDIVGFTDYFHELVLMFPTMVTPEYNVTSRTFKRIQGNLPSSNLATTNEAIRMAHSLMDQVVWTKAIRLIYGNKRKWEDQQRGNNKNNNTHHHQQNRRHEVVRAYAAAPAERRGYAGDLP
nr:hypothetical protein [Tanacetum cinerariifolium]